MLFTQSKALLARLKRGTGRDESRKKPKMSIQWPFVLPPRFMSGQHWADMR